MRMQSKHLTEREQDILLSERLESRENAFIFRQHIIIYRTEQKVIELLGNYCFESGKTHLRLGIKPRHTSKYPNRYLMYQQLRKVQSID